MTSLVLLLEECPGCHGLGCTSCNGVGNYVTEDGAIYMDYLLKQMGMESNIVWLEDTDENPD